MFTKIGDQTIVGVAIKINGMVRALPKPNRHHHLIREASDAGVSPDDIATGQQGFVTGHGDFVDRKLGAEIALETKQIEKLKWPPNLYSEDLW